MDYQLAVGEEDTLDRAVVPAEPLAEDPQPAAPALAWAPDDAEMPDPAEEPEAFGQGDPDQPMALSESGAEAEPVPEPVTEPPAVVVADGMSTRWSDIQAMFVDDPRSSAEGAAGLVEDSVQELVAFVREQQDALLAAWQGQDTGTEELRTAVQHYRAFGNRLADFCRES
jgi:hypothetical protein